MRHADRLPCCPASFCGCPAHGLASVTITWCLPILYACPIQLRSLAGTRKHVMFSPRPATEFCLMMFCQCSACICSQISHTSINLGIRLLISGLGWSSSRGGWACSWSHDAPTPDAGCTCDATTTSSSSRGPWGTSYGGTPRGTPTTRDAARR